MKNKLQKYIENFGESEDNVLKELERETNLKTVQPRMLSGPYQCKFLELIGKMIKPNKILEIGTFTGYSTICLAKGLSEDGFLYTIEKNDERENIIKKHIKKSGFENKIKLITGDALKIIPKLDEKFDLVFLDADKKEYLDYYNAVFPKVKNGGFIIADNVLWNGKILDKVDDNDKSTRGIIKFNEFVRKDKNTEKIILPIRDGLMLIRKK